MADALDLLEAAGVACCVAEDVVEVAAGADAVVEVAAVVCEVDAVVDADEVYVSTGTAFETAAESEDVAVDAAAVEVWGVVVAHPMFGAGMAAAGIFWTLSISIMLLPYAKRTCRISLIGKPC